MILEGVCPSIKRLLSDVLTAKIGICAREIELVQVSSGRSAQESRENDMVNDRFIMKIPISDQLLTWEVVFNSSLPNCPPDFDLNDTDFFCSLTGECVEELLPSLSEWDYRNDKALINVITELRSAYLKYQVERLESLDDRCAFEYTSLINERKFPVDRVEVYTENNVINFFIKLEVNLPVVPPFAGDYFFILSVKFGVNSNARSINLLSSENAFEALGTIPELTRNIKCDENLSEYVEEVSRTLEEQALTITMNRQKKRKQFIFEMLKHLGHSVVSYDALEYNHGAFLLQKDGFVCILDVTIPPLFPDLAPIYRLISMYNSANNKGQPLVQKLTTAPFSDKWEPIHMVEQALAFLQGKAFNFFRDATMKVYKLPK